MNSAAVRCAARTLLQSPGQGSGGDSEATVFLAPVGDPAGGFSSAFGIRAGVEMIKLVLNSNSRRGNKTCARASGMAAKSTNNNKQCFTAILRAHHVSCLPTIKSFFRPYLFTSFSLLSTSRKNSRARVARFAERLNGAASHLPIRVRARDPDKQRDASSAGRSLMAWTGSRRLSGKVPEDEKLRGDGLNRNL